MKEALYYKKLKEKIIQCKLCPRYCVIKDRERGNCGVRENQNGRLYSLVYGKPCAVHIDPIEKKPLYHFLPGSLSFSIGTVGCNLHCLYCQNWGIAQIKFEDVPSMKLEPEDVVKKAIENDCKSIAYTYTEPTIFIEYLLEIAKIAKKKGIKNVIVSNGFVNEEPLNDMCKVINGANIDLKSFSEEFYKKISNASLKPILNSLKILKKNNIWLEITNLIVPGLNDNIKEIEKMCKWIKENLGKNVPLHFSRFFPYYKMLNMEITPEKTLLKAKEIGEKYLDHVYIGNIKTKRGEDTYCPKCKKLLVKRDGFRVIQNKIENGKCRCGEKVYGVWE